MRFQIGELFVEGGPGSGPQPNAAGGWRSGQHVSNGKSEESNSAHEISMQALTHESAASNAMKQAAGSHLAASVAHEKAGNKGLAEYHKFQAMKIQSHVEAMK